MELILLGTGTSQGVPMIAHDDHRLDLSNPKNHRTRPSIHVVLAGIHLQIDAGPDLRRQCLDNNIRQVDEVIITHGHADHMMGMDDLRRFCTLRGSSALNVYSNPLGLRRIASAFDYAVREVPEYQYYPAFRLREMPEVLELPGGRVRS